MKVTLITQLFTFIFFIAITACDKEKESEEETIESPRIRKYSKVISPAKAATHKLGDIILFSVKSDREIDSIQLEYQKATTYTTPEFEWNSVQAKTGMQKLKLTVYSDGESETHYPQIKFLSDVTPEQYTYRVIRTLPHDETAYTQGLFFKDDTLYESTGPYLELNGPKIHSRLMKVDLNTAEVYRTTSIESQYFGEGSTYWQDNIYMLTWTSQTGFIFDRKLNQTGTFKYTHEGWGMTAWGDTLIVSDGKEILHLIDPRDFSELGKLQVYTDQKKVLNINELEIIDDLLYANIYQEKMIAVIDPRTGKVLREIDMTGLLSDAEAKKTDVLNGIAHNPRTGKTYVTGKLWPKLFEVEFIPK